MPKVLILVLLLLCILQSVSQDMEPRTLSSTPKRLNFVGVGYAYSWGNIMVDPSLPADSFQAKVQIGFLAFVRSFAILKRQASLQVFIPYARASADTRLADLDTAMVLQGFADPFVRLSILLIGPPSVRYRNFESQEKNKFSLGLGLGVYGPLGKYSEDEAVNLGTNRWTGKVTLGAAYKLRGWNIEGYAGLRAFSDNAAYLGDQILQQDPIWNFSLHLVKIFRGGVWAALSTGRSEGGATTVDGLEANPALRSIRYGATLAVPMDEHSSLKIAFTSSEVQNFGAKYNMVSVLYQFRWLDPGEIRGRRKYRRQKQTGSHDTNQP